MINVIIMSLLQSSNTPLNRAMKGGNAEVVKFLLSQGAKVSAYLSIHIIVYC